MSHSYLGAVPQVAFASLPGQQAAAGYPPQQQGYQPQQPAYSAPPGPPATQGVPAPQAPLPGKNF